MKIIDSLSQLFRRLLQKLGVRAGEDAGEPSSERLEGLRGVFKVRYHNFKMLLAANNEALEVMSGLEDALRGTRTFGMHNVRAGCTRIIALTYRSIRHLGELAPGRHALLEERFKIIRDHIEQIIGYSRARVSGPLVLSLREGDKSAADLVGPKMANLGEVARSLGLRVPNGFVVTASAYDSFMRSSPTGDEKSGTTLAEEIARRIQLSGDDPGSRLALASDLRMLIIGTPVPEFLRQAMLDAYDTFILRPPNGDSLAPPRVAIRSSSLGEDLPGASFAGQFRSKINVSRESLVETYKEIVASKFGLEAMSYRLQKGLPDEDTVMCVGVQRMIEAVAGGVVYSRDPLGIRGDVAVVYSVFGLPKQVVDGTDRADFHAFERDGFKLCEREITEKGFRSVCDRGEGVRRVPIPAEEADTPSLSIDKAREVARMSLAIERHFGEPQDIEWALDTDGRLHVLQTRPLLLMARKGARLADLPQLHGGTQTTPNGAVALGHGVTASPGTACGEVFVASRVADILAVPEGAVLVVAQPQPLWAVNLPDVAAIVAEEGSSAGHLASVAREFGTPALFGVLDATRRLVPGTTVTVDADGMAVYEGRIESLLHPKRAPSQFMEGTPVHDLLARVTRHVVPLNLVDPGAASFSPPRCETLHDLLRYCHEMGLRAMFSFGSDNPFPERGGKQLVCGVPMQFWVIDLDDGFIEPVHGPRVDISNIRSEPMLTLWRGMTAIPWDGPPAPKARGLASIFHEATINTNLDVSMPSAYRDQNYFMISRDFVSQQSRFGFHFSTVEALVGGRKRENYLNFSFKGGAANHDRRILRAKLVADVLESLGFTVRLTSDAVSSSIINRDADFLQSRLAAVGYLTMHTRQLDMVMDPGSLPGWKDRLLADLERIVSGAANNGHSPRLDGL